MERLSDSELEELVLGIEGSIPPQEESVQVLPLAPRSRFKIFIYTLAFAGFLGLGLLIGMGVATWSLRKELSSLSTQLEKLLSKFQEYENPTFSKQEVIEPLTSAAPFDRAA